MKTKIKKIAAVSLATACVMVGLLGLVSCSSNEAEAQQTNEPLKPIAVLEDCRVYYMYVNTDSFSKHVFVSITDKDSKHSCSVSALN